LGGSVVHKILCLDSIALADVFVCLHGRLGPLLGLSINRIHTGRLLKKLRRRLGLLDGVLVVLREISVLADCRFLRAVNVLLLGEVSLFVDNYHSDVGLGGIRVVG